MRFLSLSVLLILLCIASAHAEDADGRTISLPRAGLSLDVPEAWTIAQYTAPLLELTHGDAWLRIRAYDGSASRTPTRTWTKAEEGGAKLKALLARDGAVVFEVEGVLPAGSEGLRDAVDGVLDSVDTTPFVHGRRHVDWNDAWTLEVPEGFTRVVTARGHARFESERDAFLEVDALDAFHEAVAGAAAEGLSPGAWVEFLKQDALKRVAPALGLTVLEVLPWDGGGEDVDALLVGLAGKDGKQAGTLVVAAAAGFRVAMLDAVDGGREDVLKKTLATFRTETDPGPRVGDDAAPTDRFPGEQGPPVAFDLPEGWTLAPGSNQMRLAQATIDGVEDADVVVFYFGAGMGGTIEGNLERWRSTFGGAKGTTEEIQIAEDVKATLLDVSGTQQTAGMGGNPHGGNPHGMGVEGRRLLAAILEVPEGPLFVKWVGPKATIDAHEKTFRAWISSFRSVR